jgi:hypothetical protein
MSTIEYERRIIYGIPVNVIKGTTKTETSATGTIDLYTWNDKPVKFGKYNYDTNEFSVCEGFTESKDAVALLKAWRSTQTPRSRAELRTGR